MIGAPDDNYRPSKVILSGSWSFSVWQCWRCQYLYGTANGLNAAETSSIYKIAFLGSGYSRVADEFGAALSLGDLNSDGFLDLVIGAPGETINGHNNAGATHILRQRESNKRIRRPIPPPRPRRIHRQRRNKRTLLGGALLITQGDTIIGSPGATISGAANAGAIYYLAS